ncbi:putative clathrin assembly protein At1g03050 [Tripterygium wilfordii]|uniref:putative clathrin assembly protein At1g03050 n=1 Tax=Tripterygium wilfordii TaxID=458696 RepID=UPI0018F839C3|nr:putative clathrin assembly protein At1g03050 [Tripterygium wilfordii]
MAPSKIRRALGAVKDQTSIGLAKVNNTNSLSDLDVAIVKATRHEEYPTEEKYIREILNLTSYSRTYISACVNTLSRRLNKTKNWIVAIKTLILIQRLIAEGDPAYEQEIFFATRRGTRLLNMSDFRHASKSYNSWDYSAFVRTYALYLDERLEFRMQGRRGKRSAFGFDEEEEEEEAVSAHSKSTPVREMKTEHVFSRAQHLQQLLERFLACRPTGAAKNNRIVIVALYPVVKESFQIYSDVTEVLGILIDRFMELEVPDSVKVYEIFCRVSKQFDELETFYAWCKTVGIVRSSEYPDIEKITQKKLDLMDDFIRDKSALAQTKRDKFLELKNEPEEETKDEQEPTEEEEKEDMNAIKALPAPESVAEEENIEEPKEKEKEKTLQLEGDLLNLRDDAVTSEDHADKLALALFDGGSAHEPTQAPTWEAFNNDGDWETALVQSASNLSYQKPSLGGGFDKLLLDGMYQQGAVQAAMANASGSNGSASSVAIPLAGQPAMLALPAPPVVTDGSATPSTTSVDPFAASLTVAMPPYVQMSEMEKKQRLLVEEQLMWQQYQRNGMQGQIGLSKLQEPSPYNMEGYI